MLSTTLDDGSADRKLLSRKLVSINQSINQSILFRENDNWLYKLSCGSRNWNNPVGKLATKKCFNKQLLMRFLWYPENNRGRGRGYQPKRISQEPNLIIVSLHIERKKCFRFFTDGKQHKTRELDMIILSNRIYKKILDRNWSSARYLSRNQRAITWVSNYRYPIWTFCNWIPAIG